ncbi:hypothetical protein INR49_018803 [Caranx melampygus]|nr:hypothetical protein INR49_018803 [Caranx melampygus]
MPSFDFLDKVELYLRTGTHPVGATKNSKTHIRAASKHFSYRDGSLWRTYRGRLLKVVRSDEEVREILTRYHDNNNHAGRARAVKEVMLMYYWVGVTEAMKTWIKACTVCQSRVPSDAPAPAVHFCLVYGCDASSYSCPELSFHRFPKEAEQRRTWLAAAQRDEGSLRNNSCICSRHFDSSCFMLSEDGQLTLSPDAVPAVVVPAAAREDEAPVPSDDDFLPSNSVDQLLSTTAAAGPSEPGSDPSEVPAQLQEHQYCLTAPHSDSGVQATSGDTERRTTVTEPSFVAYNRIARYLSHRVLPMQSKKSRGVLKKMAKRFGLIDGELMYTRVSPPLRVPRSREEVNSILQQFHDNQGHYSQGICQREITKHFYWSTVTRDVACWIAGCSTCLNRTKRKWLRCSVYSCKNCCGPVERGLGLTFHKFPLHDAGLLARWLKAVARPHWHPQPGSSICSTHFTEDCFDHSGEKVVLLPDAVPTLLIHDAAAHFAKYDAVELYLRERTYPHGLNYVEKNTFRRFCKKFSIKDDELHMTRGDRVRLVLRNRQQVEAALTDYHNELNHLDINKCLRLLNERFFWKTMRADVVQWINSCSQCSRDKGKKAGNHREAGGSESELRPLGSPQIQDGLYHIITASHQPGNRFNLQVLTWAKDLIIQTQRQNQVSRDQERVVVSSARSSSSCGLEPVVAPSTKPWPVFTIAGSASVHADKPPPEVDSPAVLQRPRRLQARTIIQQCSRAKVKIKPALDGAEPQWAEIQEGMVVYVCFFHGAAEDVTTEVADRLMTTKLFRRATGRSVSVLDLPGSVLFIPQDSLLGEPAAKRRVQYKGGCEPWQGAQLLSNLASACRELMAASVKCVKSGVKVEQGVYGQKQEVVLNSAEPLTLLLEF